MDASKNASDDLGITFYGHASIGISMADATSVVVDPWFSAKGAFLSSWSQFPDNSHLSLDGVRTSDFIVISHDHEDHFDLEFLRTVGRDTTLVVPNYYHGRLREMIQRELANRVVVVNDREAIELGEQITMVPMLQSVPVWDDCAFVFEIAGKTIVDLNDIKLPAAELAWIAHNFTVDYLFLQYSGANWYPRVYTYDSASKADLARRSVETKFRSVANIVEQLNPACVVPCAGPPCFLDEDLFDLNGAPDSIFPTQAEFLQFAREEGFGDRVAVLLPGDRLSSTTDWRSLTAANLSAPPFASREQYLRDYARRRRPTIKTEVASIEQPRDLLLTKCRQYFEPLIRSTPYLAGRIGGVLLLDLTGPRPERIVIDFMRAEEPVRAFSGEEWFYRLRTEARYLNEILEGRLTWEELLLSMRFEATRRPDIYNEQLIVFLRYADPKQYALYEQYQRRGDSGECFVLEHDGKQLYVQRTCPHAGGDLSKGRVEGDDLVCPVHGWRFSLRDGACVRTGYRISVEPIVTAEPARSA